MNKLHWLIGAVSVAFLVALIGCSSMQSVITPAFIDPEAIAYSEEKPTMFTPWTSLWDMERIARKLNFKHFCIQMDLIRDIEDDNSYFGHLKDALAVGRASATELKDNLFDARGPLGFLLASLPGLGIGTYLLSKPADKKKIEELKNGGK